MTPKPTVDVDKDLSSGANIYDEDNDPSWGPSIVDEHTLAAMDWIRRRAEWLAAWNRMTNSAPRTTAVGVMLP